MLALAAALTLPSVVVATSAAAPALSLSLFHSPAFAFAFALLLLLLLLCLTNAAAFPLLLFPLNSVSLFVSSSNGQIHHVASSAVASFPFRPAASVASLSGGHTNFSATNSRKPS